MDTIQQICALGRGAGGTRVSPWPMSLTTLLIYNACLKSMPCAHNLHLSSSQAPLGQVDPIWAAEHSEQPNPHASGWLQDSSGG